MTLPLELGGISDDNARHALELIAQKFPLHAQDFAADVLLLASTGTARKIAFGTVLVNTATTVNVTHGLGTTPSSVVAVTAPGIGNTPITWAVTAVGATTFTLGNAGGGLNSNAYWIAIG